MNRSAPSILASPHLTQRGVSRSVRLTVGIIVTMGSAGWAGMGGVAFGSGDLAPPVAPSAPASAPPVAPPAAARENGDITVHMVRAADLPALKALRPGEGGLLLNVWATWCRPCVEEMPHFVALAREFAPQGLRFAPLSMDFPEEREAMVGLLSKLGYRGTAYLRADGDGDQTFVAAVNPQWSGELPATFLFNAQGTLVRSWEGPVSEAELKAALRLLFFPSVGEEIVSPAPTDSPSSASPSGLSPP